MYTDPTRIHADDPGHVEGNVVFMYLDAFHGNEQELSDMKNLYIQGKLSDGELKRVLSADLVAFLAPIREKRSFYQQHPEMVRKALIEGSMRAKEEAVKTMGEVKEAMRITNY
jgi:tryptophanyl-tRNA synthetase